MQGIQKNKVVYLIGALRNRKLIDLASKLRSATGFEIFDDWIAPGEQADEKWKEYEVQRGRTYQEALKGFAATHVFEFDKHHLDRADIAVLVMPAGRSAFLELGYHLGKGKPGYIFVEPEQERWDVMFQFATGIVTSKEELIECLNDHKDYVSVVNPSSFAGNPESPLNALGEITDEQMKGMGYGEYL